MLLIAFPIFSSLGDIFTNQVINTKTDNSELFSLSMSSKTVDTLDAYATGENGSTTPEKAKGNLNSSSLPTNSSLLRNNANISIPSELTTTINEGKTPLSNNFNITKGYKIEPVLWNLTTPSSVAFDDKGNVYLAEAGNTIGGLETTPRILKIDSNNKVSSLVERDLYGPITDIEYHDGKLYVSNRAKISYVDVKSGVVSDIIVGLPSLGNFKNTQMVFGPDGRLYFGEGTVTNSGVIGKDSYPWLKLIPMLHGVPKYYDIPGKNITLTGQNFETSNILTRHNATDNSTTGAFVPFGNYTYKNQVILGDNKCNGCILSTQDDGSDLKLIGWGLRNPTGLAFENGNSSTLLVTNEGADEIGSRPIANDSDKIYRIDISNKSNIGQFYGWPDYFGNAEPVTDPKFQSSKSDQPLGFLMKEHPSVQKPLSLINNSAGIGQMAVSNNSNFGFKNMTFISQSGNLANQTTNSTSSNDTSIIDGQKIILYDSKSNNYSSFLSLKNYDPSFRPVDVKFSLDGSALYVVSLGKAEIRNTVPDKGFALPNPIPWVYKNTGILWKITNVTSDEGYVSESEKKDITLSPELKVTINSGSPPISMKKYLDIPGGYNIEPLLWNLDLPGSFAFDNEGNTYFASTGVTYGQVSTNPAIYKIDKNGNLSLLVDRPLHGILTDIEYNKNNGLLYVAHRNVISTVNTTTGVVNDVLVNLPIPVYVTHPLGQLAIGPDKRVYISAGGLSNTAVPDISDWGIGWIREMPFMHEIPGQNITLTGQNFMSENFLTPDPKDRTVTGGMMPFGTPAVKGQKIQGETICTSCIMSINSDGSDLKLHAWGIRNAYGMVFDDKGNLFMVSNGDDDKGIRRVTYDPDSMFMFNPSNSTNLIFFGWPDYPGSNGESITGRIFNESPNQGYLNKPLIETQLNVTPPFVELHNSVGNTQAAYSTSEQFGHKGKIFVGEFGTIAPVTHTFHKPLERNVGEIMGEIIGQKIVMVDPENRTVTDFISLKNPVASFRPVGLGFTPDGSALYVASIEKEVERKVTTEGGILSATTDYPFLKTGTIWKVTKNTSEVVGGTGQVTVTESNTARDTSTLLPDIPYGGTTLAQIFEGRYNDNNNKTTDDLNKTNSSSLPLEVKALIVKGAALKRDDAFNPNPILIKEGGTITWVNSDSVTHTVTYGNGFGDPQKGKEFDSGLMGQTYKHVFKKQGEYPYFCQIHPTMQGMIFVK